VDEQGLDHAQAREIIRFQLSYNKRKIKSTWTLAAIIIVFYLLEEYFGGSQNMALLVRMGANVRTRVDNGEYYRLFTCVFLHAGFLHVFFNTYVLIALGGFFNRILGEARYLTVFLLSGLVGSLASVLFGKAGVSVGASGAIWGLFGASLTLSLFKTSFLPEAIRLRLRRITFINLVINLGISFLPMIDIWAHLGGGFAGFLVSLVFVIKPQNRTVHQWVTYGCYVVAFILSLAYLSAIVVDMWKWRPWVNQWKTHEQTVSLPLVPFDITVPSGLAETIAPKNTPQNASFSFGNPEMDQVIFELHFLHESILGHVASRQWLMDQRELLLHEATLPAEVKKTVYYRDSLEGGMLYFEQPLKNRDLVVHNYLITRSDYAIKIGLIAPTSIKQQAIDQMADRLIGGLRHRP